MATNISYSEAIRLGSMLGPQGFGRKSLRANAGTLCANDAAMAATNTRDIYEMPVSSVSVSCPECPHGPRQPLAFIVAMHLNDMHRWTRERIADFVEKQEKLHPAIPEEAPCPVSVAS